MRKVLLALLAVLSATTAIAQEPPAASRLGAFTGTFEATLEQKSAKTKEWLSRPMTLTGRQTLAGRYVELDGTYEMLGFEKPIRMVFVWSFDPFQKEYRVAVLDDYAGLLDVFEQEQPDPLTLSNVKHGTYFSSGGETRAFTRFTVHFLKGDTVRMEVAGSADEGKTWSDYARMTLRRKPEGPGR